MLQMIKISNADDDILSRKHCPGQLSAPNCGQPWKVIWKNFAVKVLFVEKRSQDGRESPKSPLA